MGLYHAKSLKGAEREVRRLRKQVAQVAKIMAQYGYERKLLAMLAAETPQFDNPLVVMEAKKVREAVLKER